MSWHDETAKNAAIFDARRLAVLNSGLPEVGVRLRLLEIVRSMRDRAADCDRTAKGELTWRGEPHIPITSDTLRAFADNLEDAALLGLDKAVNERDSMRDIVGRLCDELESHYYEPQSMDDPSILREARAAIGEGGLE